jgi:predicted lipid-binding transport protein (Tim44 family)
MRKAGLTLGILITTCAVALTGSAMAANSDHVLSTQLGSMTCADFTQMSSESQNQLVSDATQASPGQTLTAPASGSGNSQAATNNNGSNGNGNANGNNSAANDTSGGSASGTSSSGTLTAGDLVAACQAASPTDTVQDAYAKANSGNSGSGQ